MAGAQTVQVSGSNRTVSVTATDKAVVMADVATVHIGFIAYGPDSDAAYANGSRTSNAIAKALSAAGVPTDTVESESQSLNPVQVYNNEKLTPAELAQRKFQVSQSWTVRTGAKDASRVLDVAVKAGANQSGQIDWSLSDENAPAAEAASKALQRARSVASGMASGLSAHLGALLYASNEIQAEPVRPMMRALAAPTKMPKEVEPLAVNPRRIEKSATVTAIFAIE
jgi:uncharacterized protein YggE